MCIIQCRGQGFFSFKKGNGTKRLVFFACCMQSDRALKKSQVYPIKFKYVHTYKTKRWYEQRFHQSKTSQCFIHPPSHNMKPICKLSCLNIWGRHVQARHVWWNAPRSARMENVAMAQPMSITSSGFKLHTEVSLFPILPLKTVSIIIKSMEHCVNRLSILYLENRRSNLTTGFARRKSN